MTAKPSKSFAASVQESMLTPEEEAELEAKKGRAVERGLGSVEELDELEAKEAEQVAAQDAQDAQVAAPADEGPPPWVVIPQNMKFPEGRQIVFMRFPSEWTTRPKAGLVWGGPDTFKNSSIDYPFKGKPHRQCILWTLSVNDERLARKAAGGESLVVFEELAKRCIRAIDGQVADLTRGRLGNVPQFWEEIGPACRQQIVNYYHRSHSLSEEQRQVFFLFGAVARSAVTG
jgi:hypothetical protein